MPKKVITDFPDLIIGLKIWLTQDGRFLGLTGVPASGSYYAYNARDQGDKYNLTEDEADKFASKE